MNIRNKSDGTIEETERHNTAQHNKEPYRTGLEKTNDEIDT